MKSSPLSKEFSFCDSIKPSCCCLLKDGRVAVGTRKGEINIYDINQKKTVLSLTGHSKEIAAIAETMSGEIVSSGGDRKIVLWGENGEIKAEVEVEAKARQIEAMSNFRIATCCLEEVKIWNCKEGLKCEYTFEYIHSDDIIFVHQLKDKESIVTYGWDNYLRFFELESKEEINKIGGINDITKVNSHIEYNDKFLVGNSHEVYVVDLKEFKLTQTISIDMGFYNSVIIDGHLLFSNENSIYELKDASAIPLQESDDEESSIEYMKKNGEHKLLTISSDGEFTQWEIKF